MRVDTPAKHDPEQAPDLEAGPEAGSEPESDAEVDAEVDAADGWERPVDRFRRTATGSVLAAGLLGLGNALQGRPDREEVTIVSEAPAQPAHGNIELVLDPEHPERSVAIVRLPPSDDDTGTA